MNSSTLKTTAVALALVVLAGGSLANAAEPQCDVELRDAAQLHYAHKTAAAIVIWKKWAQQGNADAAYNLALIHQHADGVAYDPAAAVRWYRVAADLGDKVSQVQLGLMYQNGEGVPADEAKAHEWFTKSRQDHRHHDPRFLQWQQQARELIDERDRRETAEAALRDGESVLAELKRRAAAPAAPGKTKLAAAGD